MTGERVRAPAEGAIDSDIPNQSAEKKSRLGDLHLAFVTDKHVVKGHAKWWRSDMKDKVDTQARKDLGAPFGMDGGVPVLSASVAGGRNRSVGL